MIKRIVGLLAAAAVLAVIVFTLLGSGTYSSFIERRSPSAGTAAAAPAAAPEPSDDRTANGITDTADTAATGVPADTSAISGTADSLPAVHPSAE